jgi:hypothetical protein
MAGRSLGDPLLCLSGYETLGDGVVPAALVSTPTAAQTVLSSIATAMITLLTLVLTVTTVAVQLAILARIVRARTAGPAESVRARPVPGHLRLRVAGDPRRQRRSGERSLGSPCSLGTCSCSRAFVLVLYVHHAGQRLRASGADRPRRRSMRDELSTWCCPVEATRAGTEPAAIVATEPGVVWS